MRRFLFDTAVFVYVYGRSHPYREPCRAIVARQAAGELEGEASVDLLQELAHRRFVQTRDRAVAAGAARDVSRLCRLHELRSTDLTLGLQLFERHARLDARDAVFAAVALNRGIDAILSPDRAFQDVPGLQRVDPADASAVQALGA